MKTARIALPFVMLVFLAACEQKQPYQPPVPQTEKEKADARLFSTERKALEKAKGVEGTVEQGAEERKAAEEKQTN